MGADLVEIRPGGSAGAASDLVAWADAAQAAYTLAESIVRTNVCPPNFRGKAQEATAVILLGAELGLTPITALRSMYELRGQIGMYTRAQVALAQAHGHRIWTVRESDDEVVVAGARADDPDHVEEVTWSIARARRAGFVRRGPNNSPSQYETQPRVMLWSRAAGEVARRIAADALAGIPELDDPGDASRPATGEPAAPARVIQRQPRQVTEPDWPVGGRPQVDVDLPPTGVEDTPPDQEPPAGDASLLDTLAIEDPPDYVDEEPRVTSAQMRMLHPLFIEAGVRGTDRRHEYLSRWLGREIASTNDITVTEASAIIDRLQQQVRGDA